MAEKTEFLQAINEAILDADSLERFINGSDSETVLTRLSAEYPTLQKAIKNLFENGGLPATPFKTKALMEGSSIADGSYAAVTNDPDVANIGLYIKEDGVWSLTGYDQISPYIERADKFNKFEVVDIDFNPIFKQKKNGDIVAPYIGNLTKFVQNVERQLALKSRPDMGAVHLTSKHLDSIRADGAEKHVSVTTLQTRGDFTSLGLVEHGVTALRGSNMVRFSSTEFAFITRARDGAGDLTPRTEYMQHFTVDPDSKTITLGEAYITIPMRGEFYSAGSSYAVLDNGDIVCCYVVRTSDNFYHELYTMRSSDRGATWSTPVDISNIKNELGWNALTPISMGFVKRFGRHKGRVILPCWTTQAGYTGSLYRSGYMYSDDNGVTWNLGEFIDLNYSNECQAAEDLNGDMVFAIRVERDPATDDRGVKFFARHCDITKQYTLIDSGRDLSDERIMSGLYQGDNPFDNSTPKLLFSTCLHTNRRGLGIHTSYDGGVTWSQYRVAELDSQLVAYTVVSTVTPTLVLVVFETGSAEMRAVLVSTNNLINGDV